jgi:hypothetical protein
MKRRHGGEQIEPYRRRLVEADGWALRDRIATWATSAAAAIAWPELPEQITDRNADLWEPLIAIADAVGGSWPSRARVTAVTLVAEARDVEPSLGIRLLADLRGIFTDIDELPSKAVLQGLHSLAESPWMEIKGKMLDERGLAYRLRQFGIRSKTVRSGGTTIKGYARADFVDVWARYLPPSPATSVTSVTAVTPGGPPVIRPTWNGR